MTDNDRELLEMAARAAGYDGSSDYDKLFLSMWRPLTDDGDTLRLARIRLMTIDFAKQLVICPGPTRRLYFPFPDGNYKRAVVEAAAEIGRNMK